MSNKRIIYYPKTVEQVKAVVAIGNQYGYPAMDAETLWCPEAHRALSDGWCMLALRLGLGLVDNSLLDSRRGVFIKPDPNATGNKFVSTLDELLAALTAKPEKQPKSLGNITVQTTSDQPCRPNGPSEYHTYEHWLLPDGCVQVGCTIVTGERFKLIHKEWVAYMGESV